MNATDKTKTQKSEIVANVSSQELCELGVCDSIRSNTLHVPNYS